MALIESCAAVSTDFATWFPCLLDTLFLGNPVLAEIMFFIVFGLVAWKANLPAEFVLPISTLVFSFRFIQFIVSVGVGNSVSCWLDGVCFSEKSIR